MPNEHIEINENLTATYSGDSIFLHQDGDVIELNEDSLEGLVEFIKKYFDLLAFGESERVRLLNKHNEATALCQKFVGKVQTGRAQSIETYSECLTYLGLPPNDPLN